MACPDFGDGVDHISREDGCKVYFKDGSWVICRFSGTEPLLRMAAEAEEEGFAELAAKFRGVAAIEKAHEERYRKLLSNVQEKQAFEKSGVQVWECRNCGHIHEGPEAPESCPTCAHPQSYFELRVINY